MISVRWTLRSEKSRSFYHGYDFENNTDRKGYKHIDWNWREYAKFCAEERLHVLSVAVNNKLVWEYSLGWLIDIETYHIME